MLKVLRKECEPIRKTKYSSCVDLCSAENVIVMPGTVHKLPLGVAIDPDFFAYEIAGVGVSTDGSILKGGDSSKVDEFMESHCLLLKVRSSTALNKNLMLANNVGEIDLDYNKEICALIYNFGTKAQLIEQGEPICQIKLVGHKTNLMGFSSDTIRDGGFGSTNKDNR